MTELIIRNIFLYLGIAILTILIIFLTCLNSCLISVNVLNAFMFLLTTSRTAKLQLYLSYYIYIIIINICIYCIIFRYLFTLLPYNISSPSSFFNAVIVAATLCSSTTLSAVTFLLLQTFTASHCCVLILL